MTTKHQEKFLQACKEGDQELVKSLLDKIKDKDFCSDDGRMPMYMSIESGNLNLTNFLIDQGFPLESCNDGLSPLAAAIVSNSIQAIDLLVKKGADVNKPFNNSSKTLPLGFAVFKGKKEIVMRLIEEGADINQTVPVHLEKGTDLMPLLCIAAQSGNLDILEILAENADVNQKTKMGVSALWLLFVTKEAELVDFQTRAAKILLQKGARLDAQEENKDLNISSSVLPIMFGLDIQDKKSKLRRERLILDVFKNKLADPNFIDISGQTTIKLAAGMGSVKLVKFLIDQGIDPNKTDNEGFNALHSCCGLENPLDSSDIANLLFPLIKEPNLKAKDGFTPAEIAFSNINYETANIICTSGGKIPKNAYIKQDEKIMPLWLQLVCHLRFHFDVLNLTDLIRNGMELRELNCNLNGNKVTLNILGVILARILLQSDFKQYEGFDGWHYTEDPSQVRDKLDLASLVPVILEKHPLKKFNDIVINKNTYKIEDMLRLAEDNKLINKLGA